MRLWHKDLISVLPKNQLLGQWRECCAIAASINKTGSPNHILVNKIMDYPMEHFFTYGYIVWKEMYDRGYKVDYSKFIRHFKANELDADKIDRPIFSNWHNDRYLWQCYYNLQEKYDCGGISEAEWQKIEKAVYNKKFL